MLALVAIVLHAIRANIAGMGMSNNASLAFKVLPVHDVSIGVHKTNLVRIHGH